MEDPAYYVDGNQAVEFKIVRTNADVYNEAVVFKPVMCHQIFGASETLYGFKDLKIKLYYTAGSLQVYCGFEYSDKVDNFKITDILAKLSLKYQFELIVNLQDFENILSSEKCAPLGTLLYEFKVEDKNRDGERRNFEVYYCNNATPGFQEFHQRLQTFILWFIDAASYIDIDDCWWNFFIVYEKYNCGNCWKHGVVGYASVYDYYAYPEHIRPRISQVLILPPFQSKGICVKLLNTIYDHYLAEKSNILDFTVEDPSEDFQRVRDFVDCIRVMSKQIVTPHTLENEPRHKLIKDMHTICKINQKQGRRIYEILMLKQIQQYPDKYDNYRIEVKRRLNQPFDKQKKIVSKCRSGITVPPELYDSLIDDDERKNKLETMFLELVEQYSAVIKRLEAEEMSG